VRRIATNLALDHLRSRRPEQSLLAMSFSIFYYGAGGSGLQVYSKFAGTRGETTKGQKRSGRQIGKVPVPMFRLHPSKKLVVCLCQSEGMAPICLTCLASARGHRCVGGRGPDPRWASEIPL
jgi:hypothetical protein